MKTTFRTVIGRPEEAVRTPAEGPDKWVLLDRLTTAAEDFELSHRTLTVLKALLSFLPTREIPDGPAGIVFASNARLSERLHGMPESTLRRHLSRLVQLGLLLRHDSPNRKRFARNHGGEIALAFGFDLSPLVVQAQVIEDAAREAEARHARLLAQRDRVLVLRHALIRQGGADALVAKVGRELRRKPDAARLDAVERELRSALALTEVHAEEDSAAAATTGQVSAKDSQNERHIQDSTKSHTDSESARPKETARRPADNATPSVKDKGVTLQDVLEACKEMRAFFPERLRDWHDLVRVGDRIAPMLGIDPPVLLEAKRDMGAESAAVTVVCLLEKAATIRSPGAYLRRLTQMARDGRFSLSPMLAAVANRPNCQLTI